MATATAKRVLGSGPKAAVSSLVLLIGANFYRVQILDETGGRGQGRGVRLTKPDGTWYDIDLAGTWPRCDCPDFIFRREGLDPEGCKHIRALTLSGLAARPPIAFDGRTQLAGSFS